MSTVVGHARRTRRSLSLDSSQQQGREEANVDIIAGDPCPAPILGITYLGHVPGILRRGGPHWAQCLVLTLAAALVLILSKGTSWSIASNHWDKQHQTTGGDSELRIWAGTTAERRRLVANNEDRGSRKDWMGWGAAAARRLGENGPILAHYFLHVSKTGGTSVCQAVKAEAGCKASDARSQQGLCHTPKLDTKPKWTRDPTNYFGLPLYVRYVTYSEEHGRDPNCDEMQSVSKIYGLKFLANENFLSNDGSCSDRFLTSIVMRDPVDRILSHYNHLYRMCQDSGSKKHRCNDMLYDGNHTRTENDERVAFNVSMMREHFDIATDNYYVRILSGKAGFGSPFGFLGRDKLMLEKSLRVLGTYDWIMLIDSGGRRGGSRSGTTENALIFNKGLGFTSDLGRDNSHRSDSHYAGFTVEDETWLASLNSPDYALFAKAERLHALDVASIHKLEVFAPKVLRLNQKNKRGKKKCCGHICKS